MTTRPLELFYSYAREDEALRDQLNQHLKILKRQGFIHEWHDRDISAGNEWAQKIDEHLKSADIILLLISSAFLASDYCYDIEMKEALRRHKAGEARVIPIILRMCDWKTAPFGKLQALPRDARPVMKWEDRDEAFTDIAQGIRRVIAEMNDAEYDTEETQPRQTGKTRKRVRIGMEEGTTATVSQTTNAPNTLNTVLKRAIDKYYKELKEYEGQADYELALRSAFQNLLAEGARAVKWKLIPEQTIEGNIRPDGVLRDEFDLRRGIWEAKGPKSNFEAEIQKKIADGYPLINAIFENTRQAVLYQNKKRVPNEYDLSKPNDVRDLLIQFLTYIEPEVENFEAAVDEFKERIPELARALLAIINREHKQNKAFITAFESFAELCRTTLDPKISTEAIDEMLVQHLLTERLFRTVFDNPDFVRRNVIAAKIEEVIQALTSRSFNRQEFLRSLDRFYLAIEGAAKSNGGWSERQHFLNTVYERFFQGFSVKQADVLGTVYTPQEIVDFMVASVDEVLKNEFGASISEPGVKILDPAVGTGSYIVNIMHRIPPYQLKYKYQQDLFCNEIALLPYYIASMNIEHEYYEKMGQYEPFEGICFADTLELAEGQQLSLFVEENTERVQREKDAQIMVVIGNPPYNLGQKNENENNKNRHYPVVDTHIRETYAKASKATLNTKLYDAYVKFFRWATDRLQKRDGIVCLVTNNSFLDQTAFDGMRKHLLQDFTQIYHLDLHGNVRKNPKLSGTTHNVFGIQVGVGITIAVRSSRNINTGLYYHRVPEDWRKTQKLDFVREKKSISGIEWKKLQSDERYAWITDGLYTEFTTFYPMGSKEAKFAKNAELNSIFKTYSLGVSTNRDNVVYDFSYQTLAERVEKFIENYNTEVFRWVKAGRPKDVDNFVSYEQIKWSRNLKRDFQNERYCQFDRTAIREALYRPFSHKWLYRADILVDELGQSTLFVPDSLNDIKNYVICLTDLGSEKPFMILASNVSVDMHLVGAGAGTQCFPFYTYAEDGTNRRENITDWALKQFQDKYGSQVSKWDIFHYVYGLLHHPQYRERYKENLKRDLPHIPLLHSHEAFEICKNIGQQLMDLHLNYEQAEEYHLEWLTSKDVPFSWRVEKMRLSADKRVVVVNESLRLGPLPPECFEYRLGNRSALEWVIDQYQVTKDKRSGIESDPNRLDDEEYIVRLVGRVVTVSVETVKLVNELAQAITADDWLEETGKCPTR